MRSQEPLSADLPPPNVPNPEVDEFPLPPAMRPAYRRRGDTRRNYATERVLARVAPVREVGGTYSISVQCSQCREPVTLISEEPPGELARAVIAGLVSWPTLRSGVICDSCGGEG